jgi:hypothetical protein
VGLRHRNYGRVEGGPDGTLVKALARAWRWQRMLDEGIYTSVSDIGDAENISKSHVSRILRLALLAPDIVEEILRAGPIRRSCWISSSGRCRRVGRAEQHNRSRNGTHAQKPVARYGGLRHQQANSRRHGSSAN